LIHFLTLFITAAQQLLRGFRFPSVCKGCCFLIKSIQTCGRRNDMKGRTILTILCGIGGLAASILILAGGRSLIHGGTFADGLREFWNWAIAAMAGVSCGYSYWYNETKKKDKDDKEKQ
jgi:hypothetical protein